MVLTQLEAHVAQEQWDLLTQTFRSATEHLDPGIVRTFLVQQSSDPLLWRILTFWENREALDRMRQSGDTPRGVVIFRSVGADPVLTVFQVPVAASV